VTEKEFLSEIEQLVEADPGSIKGTEALSELPRWDSLCVVGLIAIIDEHFGVTVSAKKIAEAKTLPDLMALAGPKLTRGAA
jgi:acyl carrier protein